MITKTKLKSIRQTTKLLAGLACLSISYGANAFAPNGVRTLTCVAINWADTGTELTASKCKSLATNVANYYNRNSRGVLKLIPNGVTVDVPYTRTAANLKAAEALVKRTIKSDKYIIPALWKTGGNHASNDIAHVVQTTYWVLQHEVGHLLGMGHSGQYVYNANGVPQLQNYGDADSVMGNNGSQFLNGPEYYMLGWLPKDEIATYDPSVKIYELKKVSNFTGDGLTAVVIPRPTGQPAVVSYPISCDACAALYLTSSPRVTRKVGVTKAEWKDNNFTGIRLKVLDSSATTVTVEITEESLNQVTPTADALDEEIIE